MKMTLQCLEIAHNRGKFRLSPFIHNPLLILALSLTKSCNLKPAWGGKLW